MLARSAQHPLRGNSLLCRHRARSRQAAGLSRRRHGEQPEPNSHRGAVSSRNRLRRNALRLRRWPRRETQVARTRGRAYRHPGCLTVERRASRPSSAAPAALSSQARIAGSSTYNRPSKSEPRPVPTVSTTKSAIRKAGLFYFVWVMFSYCTGGPFGLEDMVTTSGPGMTLIYLLVIPLFWSIPVSLVSAELTTAMPVEGGFYRWSRAAFGDFWGFLAGWWNWCASFLLGAVYAVNFSDYLGFYFPQLTGWRHYVVSLLVVALITWINVRGIEAVGKFATALQIFILMPVLVLVVMGFAKWKHNPDRKSTRLN